MNRLIIGGRRSGKSMFQRMAAEEMLAAGKTVLFVDGNGISRMRRVKHLTLIENIRIGIYANNDYRYGGLTP